MKPALRALRDASAVAAMVVAAGLCLFVAAGPAAARDYPPARDSRAARDYPSARSEVAIAALPPEARDVLIRIRAGGPFRFERDGVIFGNREQALPPRRRGFYHEYTVATPGVRTRGARRIVCGGARERPEACYYSDDHYASFRRIRE